MAFVFVLRQRSNRVRANVLARALKARGIDVCFDLDDVPDDSRWSASRAAIDHCAIAVVLWAAPDLTDAVFVDHMSYAKSRGKLLALALDGTRLPAALGANVDGLAQWAGDPHAPELAPVCEKIAHTISQHSAPEDWEGTTPFVASGECAAFKRTQRNRSVEALVHFLRQYSGGMFEDIVRAQLDDATRPSYQPVARTGALWRQAQLAEPGRRSENDVWRMPARSWREFSLRVLRGARAHLRWVLAAGFGLAALGVAIGFVGNRVPVQEARFGAAGFGDGAALESSKHPLDSIAVRIADANLNQDLAGEAQSPGEAIHATAVQASGPDHELTSSVPEAQPFGIVAENPAAAVQPPLLQATSERLDARRETLEAADALAFQAARAQDTIRAYDGYLIAFPAGAGVAEARAARQRLVQGPPAYDLEQLEPDTRDVVTRARRSEGRAIALAVRQNGAASHVVGARNGGAGAYQGEWSNGSANGLGLAVWAGGRSYAGPWRASQPDGVGVLRLADGSRYEGEFAGGAPTGRGVFWNVEGHRLAGGPLFSALIAAR